MNRKLLIALVCLIWLLSIFAQAQTAKRVGTITVTVMQVRSDKGCIYLALFKSGEAFPKSPEKAFKREKAHIRNGKATAFFDDVPYGDYAIAVFHDEDNDGKLAYGMLGIPKEGYGFSNNAGSTFGPPSFDDAKITLNGEKKVVLIKVKYSVF